jgi:phosphatidylserine/phosphatidylglycerophosphate/cardiolipin synthase-like enzyme
LIIYNSLDDGLSEITRERILEARRRVYACFYIASLPFIVQGLVLAKRKGREVKAILSNDPMNVSTVGYLESHGIPVKTWRQDKGIMHIKMLICDDVALLGSYNPTYYASSFNVELLIEIRDRVVVEDLAAFFMRLWRMC